MWRNTMLPIRLWVIDARALIPALVFVMHWSLLTLKIAIAGILLFAALEWFGIRFGTALRIVRGWLYGPLRPAMPARRQRRWA
jgi:intracellular multiplication protein IcmT